MLNSHFLLAIVYLFSTISCSDSIEIHSTVTENTLYMSFFDKETSLEDISLRKSGYIYIIPNQNKYDLFLTARSVKGGESMDDTQIDLVVLMKGMTNPFNKSGNLSFSTKDCDVQVYYGDAFWGKEDAVFWGLGPVHATATVVGSLSKEKESNSASLEGGNTFSNGDLQVLLSSQKGEEILLHFTSLTVTNFYFQLWKDAFEY